MSRPMPFSAFSFLNMNAAAPRQTLPYQMMLPAAEAPSRRNGDRNSPNGSDALGSELESSGQNGSLGNPRSAAYDTNSSSKPAPNHLNAVKAWSSPDNPEGLGRGMDRMDSRYGQPNGPLESLTSSEKRDRLGTILVLAMPGTRIGRCDRDEASGLDAKTRISELLNQQNKSFMDENSSRVQIPCSLCRFQGYSRWAGRCWSGPRCRRWIGRRRATMRTGSRSARPAALFAFGRFSGNQDERNVGGLSATSAWGGEVPGSGSQARDPQPAQSRKKTTSSSSSQGRRATPTGREGFGSSWPKPARLRYSMI